MGRHIYLTKSLHSSSMKVTQRGKTSYITHTDIATYRLNWHRDRFSESLTWKNKFAIHMNFKRRRYLSTNRRKYPIGYNIPNWVLYPQLGISKPQLVIFNQLGISDLFSDSALLDSYIPNPQLAILEPIGYIIPNWIYYPQLEIWDIQLGIICPIGDIFC